ncbi:basic secretory protein-like protein [Singulisphaera rosea]
MARGRNVLIFALLLGSNLGPGKSARADDPKAPAVRVRLDVSEVPELTAWGEKAKSLCETWYPKITEMLETDGFRPPRSVTLAFKKDMDGVAGTSGSKIEISAKWVQEHPDDFGMVIHELVHVVQSYPEYRPSWVVEGIADYIRYWEFEPKSGGRRFDPKRSSYRNGYQPAASLLAWLEESKRKGIIDELNQALRKGTCTEATFKELTGTSVDQLWNEFLEARRRGPRSDASPKKSRLADIGPAPAVNLTDSSKNPFDLARLRGKAVLVSFVYTTCTGTCPATTFSLGRIQTALQKGHRWGTDVEFVSISLDPTRDTPEVLDNYARLHRADLAAWHFLTGPAETLNKTLADWGMWAKVGPTGVLDHPSRIFLVDPLGREREIYNLEFLTADSVLQDIELVLAESKAGAETGAETDKATGFRLPLADGTVSR